MRHRLTFGEAIRARRQQRGISLRTLSAMTGINKSVLSRLEAGIIRNPHPDHLRLLAPALDLSETELFGWLDASSRERLPTLQPYLRAKYNLPDKAIEDIAVYLERYGVIGGVPADGEDEQPLDRQRKEEPV